MVVVVLHIEEMEVKAASDSRQDWHLGGLPREVWMVILERVFVAIEDKPQFSSFFSLCLVSSCWSKMVYESVTAVEGHLSSLVNDDALKRFGSLQALKVTHKADSIWSAAASTWIASTITDGGLRTATNLTRLDISDALFWVSDRSLAGLTNLTTLRLSSTINDLGLKNLTNLTTLDLTLNVVVSDDAITKLTKLTTLVTWNSALTPDGLATLTNLTSLALNSNEHNYDYAIVHLTNLTRLDIPVGSFKCVVSDEGLRCLSNLTYLDVSHNSYISDFGIKNLTKLKSLHLNDILTDAGISPLTNLTALNKRGNRLVTDACVDRLLKK